jgi:hypothetical protein
MRPCTREISRLRSSLERSNTHYGTNRRKMIFVPLQLHLTALLSLDFRYDNGGPDGRNVQTGLADWMLQQRHVWFLVISCMWCCAWSAKCRWDITETRWEVLRVKHDWWIDTAVPIIYSFHATYCTCVPRRVCTVVCFRRVAVKRRCYWNSNSKWYTEGCFA